MKNDKYVIVTGAAGGIGQATTIHLAEAGYHVIATDIKDEKRIDQQNITYIQADLEQTVIDQDYSAEVFRKIQTTIGSNELIGLVNNAAVQILGGVDSLSIADWQKTLNINLLAPFVWTQAFAKKFEQSSGCVINISSIHAKLTKENFVAYATSKAALSGMTRAMAVDLKGRFRVNAIEPAAIETDMLLEGIAFDRDELEKIRRSHPSGTLGQPIELAIIIESMLDKSIRFLNGSTLSLDGGAGSNLNSCN